MLAGLAQPCAASELTSPLAVRKLSGASEVPELWLAQRTLEREWGVSEDSAYRVIDLPGWKSEGLAMTLSGVLPGSGQLYAGEGSGWLFLAGEVLGWIGRTVTHRRGEKLEDEAIAFVGDPTDTSSVWSFQRYINRTGATPELLQSLWASDRRSYYEALSSDPAWLDGFAGNDPTNTYDSYRGLHESSQDRFRQSRYLEMALVLHHVVSAVDALRAARAHNLPLRRTIDLQLGGRLQQGHPTVRAALVRRF